MSKEELEEKRKKRKGRKGRKKKVKKKPWIVTGKHFFQQIY